MSTRPGLLWIHPRTATAPAGRAPALRRLTLGALLLFLALGARPAHAAPPPELASATNGYPCSGEGVYLYEDIDYTGACVKFTTDDAEFGDEDNFHDRASSIKFVGFNYSNGRASATLYEHAYYSGASTTFSGDDGWLGDDAVGNDRADSIRIVQRPFCETVSQIPRAECEALVALYNSTGGPEWGWRTGWLTNYLPCSWYGITCTAGHVSAIDLPGNVLHGPIPARIGDLSALKRLNLSDNWLTGGIPPELSRLAALEELYLASTVLGGTIPAELGSLQNLKKLSLYMCALTGTIPPELGNLRNLTSLGMAHNSLTGGIPAALGNLQNLKTLHLPANPLGGTIPRELGNLLNLETLVLGDDSLTGNIPAELGSLPRLTDLIVSYNPLMSGPLPQSLTNLSLTWFNFNDTALCVPQNSAFEAWLLSIAAWQGSDIACGASTPTATLVHTPTRTRTVTPWPTPYGGPKRLNLPLLLRVR